jgi:hypothetical protein
MSDAVHTHRFVRLVPTRSHRGGLPETDRVTADRDAGHPDQPRSGRGIEPSGLLHRADLHDWVSPGEDVRDLS